MKDKYGNELNFGDRVILLLPSGNAFSLFLDGVTTIGVLHESMAPDWNRSILVGWIHNRFALEPITVGGELRLKYNISIVENMIKAGTPEFTTAVLKS